MAIAAVYLCEVSQIDRVLEADLLDRRHADAALLLAEHAVAGLAVLGHHCSVGANVLAVMATETTVEVEVTDIVGMGLPVQLHLGEGRIPINSLQLVDRITDFKLLAFGQVRILRLVEAPNR